MIQTFKSILSEFKGHIGSKRYYFIYFLVTCISILLTFEPLFFGRIIKELELYYGTGSFDTQMIFYITIFWLIFVIVSQILKYIIWQKITTEAILIDYKESIKKYCNYTLDMSMQEYLGKRIGSIYKLIDRGTDDKLYFLFSFFESYIFQSVSILFIVGILFYMNVKMALISLSLLPVMIVLGYYFISTTTPRQTQLSKKWEEIFGIVGNAMSNFGLFKILGLRKRFSQEIHLGAESCYRDQMRLNISWNFSEIYTTLIIMITRVLVLASGIYYIQAGELTLAELFVIFSYIGWIYFPLGFIFRELKTSVKQITETKRMYEILGNMNLEDDIDTGNIASNIDGNIQFKDVSFSYNKERKILSKINIDIHKGKKIALVGDTGAGKSTIVNLLLRFWDVSSGSILLDGQDIKDIKKSSLRNHIGVVSQDSSLFNLSIEENLKFANPKATKKEIDTALKNAEAQFVYDLPQGIKTVIGERGLKLSGGEKQRISIARLFLKNPEILVLDEATSALDNRTEKLIQKSLDKLMKNKTSIIIAHRLSTIQHADVIYVLENGKVVESGNYTELMKNSSGKFFALANPEKLILG